MRQTRQPGELNKFEEQAWAEGYARVAGVDEVGRGPLAGPVVAAAVILPRHVPIPDGINDSKQLTAAKRDAMAAAIRQLPGVQIGIGEATVAEIDALNIRRATHLAMSRALAALVPPADYALVDGLPVPGLPVPSRAIVKGDARSLSIAAASIIAKVHRDTLADTWDAAFPGYSFSRHKGYGTSVHLAALATLGPCPLHRRSFAPVSASEHHPVQDRQPELSFGSPVSGTA